MQHQTEWQCGCQPDKNCLCLLKSLAKSFTSGNLEGSYHLLWLEGEGTSSLFFFQLILLLWFVLLPGHLFFFFPGPKSNKEKYAGPIDELCMQGTGIFSLLPGALIHLNSEPSLFLGREMQWYSMYNLWACFEAKPEPAKPYLHPQSSEVCFTLVFTHYKTEGLCQRK